MGAVYASVATAALLLSTSVLAATFTVDSVMDIADANPGDGVCETAPGSGICTLRAAIEEANGLPGATALSCRRVPTRSRCKAPMKTPGQRGISTCAMTPKSAATPRRRLM
jgi:CSLREA domain-containing protein